VETIGVFALSFCASALLVLDFVYFLFRGERFFVKGVRALGTVIMLFPILFLCADLDSNNNCCGTTALFSPPHRLSLYLLAGLCLIAYFYSSYRKKIAPPIPEVIVNCLLLTGILLNIFIAIQTDNWFGDLAVIVPVTILLLFALIRNHDMALDSL
jgi:peptidoglycan/LPS O-acetylase OafA/YrhL